MSVPKPTKKTSSPEIVEFSSKKKSTDEQPVGATKPPAPFRREKIPSNSSSRNRTGSTKDEDDDFMTLKQAKHDVFRYGIKGFSKQEQETANMQLAIKLGAKVTLFDFLIFFLQMNFEMNLKVLLATEKYSYEL